MSSSFYVLFEQPYQFSFDKVSEIFSSFYKVPSIDSRIKAKNAWGFLGERMEEENARKLAEHVLSMGIGAVVLDEQNLAQIPQKKNMRSIHYDDKNIFFILGSEAQERVLPLDNIILMSGVAFNEETSFTKTVREGPSGGERALKIGITLATGIPMGFGKSKEVKKTVKSSELYMCLDVFVKGLEGENISRLNIDPNGFNFSGLGEKKTFSVHGNLRLLLKDIVEHIPNVVRNNGVKAFLSGQPVNTMGYESITSYEKEIKWLLTLVKK